jgi:hypothetical protein
MAEMQWQVEILDRGMHIERQGTRVWGHLLAIVRFVEKAAKRKTMRLTDVKFTETTGSVVHADSPLGC